MAGAVAGAIVAILVASLLAGAAPWLNLGDTPVMAMLGGVYGIGQGMAQFFSLRSYIPPLRRSLRTNFIGTAVGSAVTGVLLVALLAIGFAELLMASGFSSTSTWILGAFIVGGFGGIAQAIVERFLLRTAVHGSYFRWIAPLALLGHVSGAIAGIVTALFLQDFLQGFLS